jgi:hypothetical protein
MMKTVDHKDCPYDLYGDGGLKKSSLLLFTLK